jgi:glycerophosphoryl diester phosphodiesterase
VVELARARSVGVLAELKTCPARRAGAMAELVAAELDRMAAAGSDGPVVLQAFDADLLRGVRVRLGDDGPRMVQLVDDGSAADPLVTPAGLRAVSTYAQGIGPSVARMLRAADGLVAPDRELLDEAHRAELALLVWTLRAENAFLPRQLRRGNDPGAPGDVVGQARLLLDIGVDGLIADSPEHAVTARDEALAAV